MNYLDTIQKDLKEAMKNRDTVRTRTLRMLLAKLKEKRIEVLHDLTEEEELSVLRKAAKERQDSAKTYNEAGRFDLAEQEKEELKIIETYLPAELNDDEIRKVVREVMKETDAENIRDLGKVMGTAMKRLSGRADGKRVQMIVRKELGD
ncbi:MAG: GatB/YqeY domain-containing protein [Candidatus Marinimicrobia bacterium]|nr:GatB/YqeY domain-containing protein [Candidatus Neomarinimicrobiota bacterium]MDD5582497.1 GatB/YqeY domain-containing protein [Candidatus Neomarinimicrobiota bacterium]